MENMSQMTEHNGGHVPNDREHNKENVPNDQMRTQWTCSEQQ